MFLVSMMMSRWFFDETNGFAAKFKLYNKFQDQHSQQQQENTKLRTS